LPSTERRRVPRFELHLPVVIRLQDAGETREALTVSRDASSNGLHFFLTEGIKDGTQVEVEMTLPNQITLSEPVRVRCLGRIQRCEQTQGANAGMAAAIEKYEFSPSSDEAPAQKTVL
jgi:hypothetical protein